MYVPLTAEKEPLQGSPVKWNNNCMNVKDVRYIIFKILPVKVFASIRRKLVIELTN